MNFTTKKRVFEVEMFIVYTIYSPPDSSYHRSAIIDVNSVKSMNFGSESMLDGSGSHHGGPFYVEFFLRY